MDLTGRATSAPVAPSTEATSAAGPVAVPPPTATGPASVPVRPRWARPSWSRRPLRRRPPRMRPPRLPPPASSSRPRCRHRRRSLPPFRCSTRRRRPPRQRRLVRPSCPPTPIPPTPAHARARSTPRLRRAPRPPRRLRLRSPNPPNAPVPLRRPTLPVRRAGRQSQPAWGAAPAHRPPDSRPGSSQPGSPSTPSGWSNQQPGWSAQPPAPPARPPAGPPWPDQSSWGQWSQGSGWGSRASTVGLASLGAWVVVGFRCDRSGDRFPRQLRFEPERIPARQGGDGYPVPVVTIEPYPTTFVCGFPRRRPAGRDRRAEPGSGRSDRHAAARRPGPRRRRLVRGQGLRIDAGVRRDLRSQDSDVRTGRRPADRPLGAHGHAAAGRHGVDRRRPGRGRQRSRLGRDLRSEHRPIAGDRLHGRGQDVGFGGSHERRPRSRGGRRRRRQRPVVGRDLRPVDRHVQLGRVPVREWRESWPR